MIRARFKVHCDDPRPVSWPIKHPYWITGYGEDGVGEYAILVAYADDEAEILRLWPDAKGIDATACAAYIFTDRFKKPDWFQGGGV